MGLSRLSAFVTAATAAVLCLTPSSALGGHIDHAAPALGPATPPGPAFNSGGPGAKWERVTTLFTGNPHTDIDFFTRGGNLYAAAGTLAAGVNGGGQSIFRLMSGGTLDPAFVSAHPSASCLSNPSAALSLQHDVEATPKGDVLLNTTNPFAVRSDAQLLVDATDQRGRCHDNGTLGISGAPRGGLELIDITDPANPVEIGLTSHIGEAHTVNVDPKRPHIAFAVTSDSVSVTCNADDTACTRNNEDPASSQRFNLDGFEVVDMASCMNFAIGTDVSFKRTMCRPVVYRYRYPDARNALGHTVDGLAGCHEVEIYPDDKLTCASIHATMVFDLSGAFDDNGTPTDYTDDRPRGTPLPGRVRPSTSNPGPFQTGAMVTDCVFDATGGELTIPRWKNDLGAPSLTGVQFLGAVFHQGRGGTFHSTEDIDVSHEAEFTHSRKFLFASDERGGGVSPPGASCSPGADNTQGNGGLHFYDPDKLQTTSPNDPAVAWQPYARTPTGEKAIYRAPIHTGPQGTLCTAHVFQLIPGQNRIFMGWYSQGTQVVDFTEHSNGTVEIKEAGWFVPENANQWVSHVFKFERNADCTFTYWGATGDFNLGAAGRSAMDVYKVTLPPPPGAPACTPAVAPPPPPPPPSPPPPPGPPRVNPPKALLRYVRGSGRLAARKVRTLSSRGRTATSTARFYVNVTRGPNGGLRGRVRWLDRGLRVNIHVRRLRRVAFSGKTATLVGATRFRGKTRLFTLRITDRGRGRLDTAQLRMRGYSRSGRLARGNVVVR